VNLKNPLSALPTATTVTTPGHDVEDHLASLFAAILGTDDLDSLVLGLVARNLNLGAGLLAKVIDCGTTGSDDEPARC
jgi:hypothetical protein